MKTPFFSVIIPTYDRADFLKIAALSVLSQSFKGYELLIVDDGSTDNTLETVKSLNNKKIRYFYQKNQGVSSARNKGIKEAKGKFLVFLDSDDRFRREKLEITYKYIKEYPGYKVFHTEEIWYRNTQLLSPKIHHKKPHGFVFSQALKLCCIGPSTAAIKKDIFEEIGGFDESMPACEDYDFWLRVTSKYPVFLIPEYLTIKQGGHSSQQSKKYPAMDKFRIYALQKLIKSGQLNEECRNLACNELKNKCSIYIKGAQKRKKTKEVIYYKNLLNS